MVALPAATSSTGEKLVKITKVENAPEADSIIKPEMEIKNEDSTTEVQASTQSTRNQSGSVGEVDSSDSGLITQIRILFGQNAERS